MSYIKYSPPVVTYKSVKLGNKISGTDILMQNTSQETSSHTRVSYNAPYNKIYVTFRPSVSLSYYEVRVTQANADWDIGVGALAWYGTNITSQADTEFEININNTNFVSDGLYRVSFYAQNSVDSSWDVSYFMISGDNFEFRPSDHDKFGVTTAREHPQQKQ